MTRTTIMGLCLAALFSMGAIAATSASAALPEFGRCVKQSTSAFQYSEAACITESPGGNTGQYAWTSGPGAKPTFTLKSGVVTLNIPEVKAQVTCKTSKGVGTVTSATTVGKVVITFTQCESSGEACTGGAKAKPGQIVTNHLTGPIGFITKTPISVGQDLAAEAPATLIAAFKCGPTEIDMRNSVIAVDSGNVDVAPTTKFTDTFTEVSGAQDPENLEGMPKDTLEVEFPVLDPGVWFGATTSSLVSVLSVEKLEIKAETKTSPKWWVEGTLLSGSEAIAEATNVTESFKQELTSKKLGEFFIQCNEVKVKNGLITGPSSRSEKAIVYEACEVIGKPECSVATTETEPLEAKLEGPTGAITLKFKPTGGTVIAKWKVNQVAGKPLCTVKGLYKANGVMICDYNEVEKEKVDHPLEFTATSGSKVTVGGVPVKFTGTDEVHLASGKKWSAW
jgi:hypothetical protein